MTTAQGRRSRRKGADAERELVALLREYGFTDATWQAAQSLLAAERAMDASFAGLRAQVKRRAELATLYRWLEDVDICFLRADGKPWLALVPADWLLALLKEKFDAQHLQSL